MTEIGTRHKSNTVWHHQSTESSINASPYRTKFDAFMGFNQNNKGHLKFNWILLKYYVIKLSIHYNQPIFICVRVPQLIWVEDKCRIDANAVYYDNKLCIQFNYLVLQYGVDVWTTTDTYICTCRRIGWLIHVRNCIMHYQAIYFIKFCDELHNISDLLIYTYVHNRKKVGNII